MEARRNLEAVYKRRLEDAEKKRFQIDLQLQVLKQYFRLYHSSETSSDKVFSTFEQWVESITDLLSELTRKLQSIPQLNGSAIDYDKIWQDASNIARSKLDKLDFIPETRYLSSVVMFIRQNMKLASEDIKRTMSETVCLNTDMNMLSRILRGISDIYANLALDVIASISHDSGSNMLEIQFEEKNNKFFLLQQVSDMTDYILENSYKADTVIDDNLTLFFICKSLSQSTGGDLVLKDGKMILYVPCEVLGECPPGTKMVPGPGSIDEPKKEVIQPEPIRAPVPPAAPVVRPPAPAPVAPPPPPAPVVKEKSIAGKTLNIMLAEDDKTLQQIFKRWWRREPNVTVFTASDGAQAVEMFKSQKFSIIFIDIEMPYKNGVEAAKEMRQYEKENNIPATPIIGVSGYTEKQYREMALQAGMNEFISKGTGYQMKDIYKIVVDYAGGT